MRNRIQNGEPGRIECREPSLIECRKPSRMKSRMKSRMYFYVRGETKIKFLIQVSTEGRI
jgi:hypothetical protein